MKAKSLITLAKEMDFETTYEYYDYCIESYINGQHQQCKQLFTAMRKKDKQRFILYLNAGIRDKIVDENVYNFYFNLL